ncbi:RIB43A-like with coiled-coils protein 1 [Acipenser ruthenus]|uniref:RIB43A-like with coiled-coils protein 1 n=1 Tax=Acipenser ruthenus TaxID=7906 RepID=UPI002741778B|nr:RIB43A-like with coiled-coils protein 1 [Acipenser ruthenus]
MYKVDVPLDAELREAAAVERRRNQELQRQSRVFNPRVRTMGLDTDSLGQQVQQRRQREESERHRERAYDAQRVLEDQAVLQFEAAEAERRRELERGVQRYRETLQRPQDSRDRDLSDPRAQHSEPPARSSDSDPRCGPASLQRFQGEDLNAPERKKAMKEESERALRRQREERERERDAQRYADNVSDLKRVELDLRAVHLSELEEQCKRAIDMAVKDCNKAQAEEVAQRRRMDRAREEEENLSEVWNSVTSDLLTENPAASEGAGQRVLTDRWRGMTPEQHSAILREREEQLAERERLDSEARQREEEWERQRLLAARAGIELEMRERDRERELRRELDRYNLQLAREQREHQDFLVKELYTNPPTAQYFTQFNTTSR